MGPKKKKHGAKEAVPVTASAAAASYDEEEGRDGTTRGPDGRQIPVAHALPVHNGEDHHAQDSFIIGRSRVDGMNAGMLLGTLDDHEDDRGRLALTLHNATLRVKATYEALKMSLEPLTFAYGEDDGNAFYEKIVNAPQSYSEDRRPAFAQVAISAMEHDEAMHNAGVAQRQLEEFDSRAIPLDLLRQVINQRFNRLEERVRNIERLGTFMGNNSHTGNKSVGTKTQMYKDPSNSDNNNLSKQAEQIDRTDSSREHSSVPQQSPPTSPSAAAASLASDQPNPTVSSPLATFLQASVSGNNHADYEELVNTAQDIAQSAQPLAASSLSNVQPSDALPISKTVQGLTSSLTSPVLVQRWMCEYTKHADSIPQDGSKQACRSVVSVSPLFPEVKVDEDVEFNAIHQRRADGKVACSFASFVASHLKKDDATLGQETIPSFSGSGNSGNSSGLGIDISKVGDGANCLSSVLWSSDSSFISLEEIASNDLKLLASITESSPDKTSSAISSHSLSTSSSSSSPSSSMSSSSSIHQPSCIKWSNQFRILLIGDYHVPTTTSTTSDVADVSKMDMLCDRLLLQLIEQLSSKFFVQVRTVSSGEASKVESAVLKEISIYQ